MQTGESSAGATPPPEDRTTDKEPITVRCLFFDGTLNNKENIRQRELDSDIYKKNRENKNKEDLEKNGARGISPEAFEVAARRH